MAEVVIPEIKHEYIRQVDTETTKNDWFDECIADNKEAAWAGIGTSENDSQYQPAPSVEPDYYMQYCSSDDYDYLKDYRLIWGYGIGIIEQDVICSLSTGEHLAEGKDACDTYATENAAGQDTDWRRGTWIKFSGNRNVSPTRIGEVTLPDRVISLKDLCAALTLENPCDFYLPQENGILNAQNLCGTKTNSPITLCLSEDAGMPFGNALNLSYAFAYTDARIWQFDTYAIDESYMFYHAKVGQLVIASMDSSCNYASKFEEAIGDGTTMITASCLDKAMFKNSTKFIVDTTVTSRCKQDVSECFYGCDIYTDITGIDFSEARNVQNMFYDVNIIEDEINLDLSSFVEHDDDVEDRFNYFFRTSISNKTINITSPNCKIKGFNIFNCSNCNINLNNELRYYDVWDLKNFQRDDNTSGSRYKFKALFNGYNITINGTIQGIGLFTYIASTTRIININSNLVVKTEQNDSYNINDIIDFYQHKNNGSSFDANYFPTIILNNNQNIDFTLNIDDFIFVNCVSFYNASSKYTKELNDINIDKTNKQFYIVNTNPTCPLNFNIAINNNSIINTFSGAYSNRLDYNNSNIPIINLINNDNEPNNDLIIYIRFNSHNVDVDNFIKINAPSCNIKFSNNIPSTIYDDDAYTLTYNFNNIKSFDDANFGNASQNRYKYFNFIIEKVNQIITNSSYNPYFLLSSNLIDKIRTNDNNIIIETNGNGIRPLALESLDKENYIEYPTINTIGDIYEIIGLMGNLQNVPLSRFLQRRWSNFVTVYIKNNLIEKLIDDIENYDIDLEDYGYSNNDYVDFSVNQIINHNIKFGKIRVNYGYTRNIVTSEIKGLERTIITSTTLYTYLANLKGNLDLKCAFDLYISDCPELTGLNYTQTISNSRGNTAIIFDETVSNITNFIFNCEYDDVIEDLNLSYMSKLTQKSINSIIAPNKFVSGCTLTIHTIPFQYITEEQKQALVDAGVTLVEYIPTETTE